MSDRLPLDRPVLDRPVPDRPGPDRYGDAVRARRAELADERALLTGSHRGELRSELALSRLAAAGALTGALAQLSREARAHVGHRDRAVRARFPALLAVAVERAAAGVRERWWAELAPGLRRIAAVRSLAMGPDWPRLPGPLAPVLPAPPAVEPIRAARSLVTGAVEGLALWRLVLLPLAALSLLGLGIPAWPALVPLAVGVGAAGAVTAVWSRRTALERAALRRCGEETLAAARAAIDADLGRALLDVERAATAELDVAVARRRQAVDAELRALAPDRAVVDA